MFRDIKKLMCIKKMKGQVFLEFTFAMVIIFLMFYAIVQIFKWTGYDLAQRRIAHDILLTSNVMQNYGACIDPVDLGFGVFGCNEYGGIGDGPLKQIDPFFSKPAKFDAVYDGALSPYME